MAFVQLLYMSVRLTQAHVINVHYTALISVDDMICMYSWSIQVYIILFSMFIYFNELMNRIVNCITVVRFYD